MAELAAGRPKPAWLMMVSNCIVLCICTVVHRPGGSLSTLAGSNTTACRQEVLES